jgi:hypothetical protein
VSNVHVSRSIQSVHVELLECETHLLYSILKSIVRMDNGFYII